MKATAYYKALTAAAGGTYSTFDFAPHLPKGSRLGKWTPPVDRLVHCRSGWHVAVGELGLLRWLDERVFVAEVKGSHDETVDGKVPCRQIRLVAETLWSPQRARLFAADCAATALNLLERPDERSVDAVRVARAFAHDDATREELDAAGVAARAAAGAAAGAAARGAARGAARAAAGDAAGVAARAAAGDAARAAAGDAARDGFAALLGRYLHDDVLPEPIAVTGKVAS